MPILQLVRLMEEILPPLAEIRLRPLEILEETILRMTKMGTIRTTVQPTATRDGKFTMLT